MIDAAEWEQGVVRNTPLPNLFRVFPLNLNFPKHGTGMIAQGKGPTSEASCPVSLNGLTRGVRAGQCCKLTGRQASQTYTLRPLSIVFLAPLSCHLLPRISQIPEPAHVPKRIPQLSRKALDCGVLSRLAGLDANQPNPPLHFQARN